MDRIRYVCSPLDFGDDTTAEADDISEQALTARDVFEVSPGSQGKWGLRVSPKSPFLCTRLISQRWTKSSPTARPHISSSSSFYPAREPRSPGSRWKLPPSHPRTFFFIDRFTDTARVIFTSNDIIANTSKVCQSNTMTEIWAS